MRRIKKFNSIRIKILIPVLALLLLTALIIFYFSYSLQKDIVWKMVKRTSKTQLDLLYNEATQNKRTIETLTGIMKKNYLRILKSIRVIISKDPGILETKRITALAKSIGVDEIHISDENGMLRWGNMPSFYGYIYSGSAQSKIFMKALEDKNFEIVQNPQMRGIDKKLFLYAGVARLDQKGIIQIGMHPKELQNLQNQNSVLKIAAHFDKGVEGYPFIIDNKGVILYHHDKSLKGKNVSSFKWAKAFLNLKDKSSLTFTYKGEEVFAFVKRDEKKMIAFMIPTKSFKSPLTHLKLRVFSIILFSVICAFIIFYFLSRKIIVKPVKEIVTTLEDMSKGNLSVSLSIKSKDEMGLVADHFEESVSNFRTLLKEIRAMVNMLFASTQQLSTTSQEISTTSAQQAAAVKEMVSTMEDSNRLSDEVSNKISEVAGISEQTKNHVDEGVSLIKQSLRKMDDIRSKNSQTITGVRSLGDKIESIWEVVNIINTIADQTKIIAFNAALEAASAGEAGKNFQIVASEIRRLADNTMNSTKEIKEKINEIQGASNQLIMSSEEGTLFIKEGWELSRNLEEIFEQILNSAEVSAKSAFEISESSSQQLLSFEQTLLTLKEISSGVENFVTSVQQSSDTSKSLKEMAERVAHMLSTFQLVRKEEDLTLDEEEKESITIFLDEEEEEKECMKQSEDFDEESIDTEENGEKSEEDQEENPEDREESED